MSSSTRSRRNAQTSDEIRAAALELFARKGYEGTTIEDIAVALGCGKASLYHYFRNKQEIFTSIVFETISDLIGNMDHLCCNDRPALEDLEAIIDHFLAEKFAKRGLFQVFHQLQTFFAEVSHAKDRDAMILRLREIMDRVVAITRRGIADGSLKNHDPMRLAELFMGTIFGVVSFTGGPPVGPDEQASYTIMVKDFILSGIRATSGKVPRKEQA